MKKIIAFSLMLFTALTFLGCSLGDDQENFHFVALPITSVEMPDSFVLNETYQIKVKYLRTSDCEYFEGFDIVKEETTVRNVAAIGSKLSDSDDCQEIEQEIETSFNFVVLYNQTYTFKYFTGNDESGEAQYLEIEVQVTE
ncbi:hypothetical protein [Cellulophaga tyrosinoxydans]|uniref:Lipoprotein n=1 Tax=Cellulophaga tyrosinoxydans TaxID=504486 RepID=A0A1W1YRZ8_9FLAO|nr:hypothetical protein [Cellulophaga tyrosinoxydans]SMC38893.1 hypothetical protein SAMN05660703_0808 [Cellulophaga tyrosinoxydans]